MNSVNSHHDFFIKLLTRAHLYEEKKIRPLRRLDRMFTIATVIAGSYALSRSIPLKLTNHQVYFLTSLVSVFYLLEETMSKWEWKRVGYRHAGYTTAQLWISYVFMNKLALHTVSDESRQCSSVYGTFSIITFIFGIGTFIGVFITDSPTTVVEVLAIAFMLSYIIEKFSSEIAWQRIERNAHSSFAPIVEQAAEPMIKKRECIVVDSELRTFLVNSQHKLDEGKTLASNTQVDFGGVANDPYKLSPNIIDRVIKINLWLAGKILYAGGAKLGEPTVGDTYRWFSGSWNDALTEINTSSDQLRFSAYRLLEAISVVRSYGFFSRAWGSVFESTKAATNCICGERTCRCKPAENDS